MNTNLKSKSLAFALCLLLLMGSLSGWAQDNPTPFNLSNGNFSFTTQVASNASYPVSMQGWTTGTNNLNGTTTAPPGANYALKPNAVTGASPTFGIGNLGDNGFMILSNTTTDMQAGAIALALNTTNRSNILVSWTAEDVNTGSGSRRMMAMELQYRIGTGGNFTTVSGSVFTTDGKNNATPLSSFVVLLPTACNDQAVVQLRWLTYEVESSTNDRDGLRLDEISVTSSSPAYRTRAAGDFSSASVWEYNVNGSTYANANNAPGPDNDVVITHAVTATGGISVNTGKSITVNSGGSLTMGTNVISGQGSVIVNSGATLKVGSTNASGAVAGNITAAGGVTLSSGSTVEFNGTGAQFSGARTYSNLILNNSSGVTMNGGVVIDGTLSFSAGKLAIGANTLTLAGTISGGSPSNSFVGGSTSNMVVNGTGAFGTLFFDQTTDGTSNVLNNFTLNRMTAGAATLGNKMVVLNTYTPTDGVLASGGFLNLRSTASNTARIAAGSSAGGYITGNVVAERFVSGIGRYGNPAAFNRAYRMLAPMVNTTTTINANWQEGQTNPDANTIVNTKPGYGTQITGSGGAANGFDPTITNQTSLYLFNPVTQAWTSATNTNVATLDGKTGYLLYMRGDRSIDMTSNANPLPATNTTLRTTGALLTGNQSFTGLQGDNKYSLVSNPFAAPINWIAINSTNTANFNSSYIFWDPNVGTRGGFVSVNSIGIPSTGSANENIQSGQAFFVQAKAGTVSPTFTINESHKSSTNNKDVFRTGSTEMFRTSLYFSDANGRSQVDGVVNVYDNAYSAAVDEFDSQQMANWDEDIAIVRSGSLLSIEMRPLIDNADTIFLQIARLKQQPYQWQFDPSGFNAPGMTAYLQDNFLSTETAISLSAQTLIDFTVTANAASSAADRFRIVFRSSAPLPVKMTSVKAIDKHTAIQVEWNTVSESAMDKYIVEKSTDGREFGAIGTVMAKNNTSATTYTWLDADRVTGGNYYRIRSVGKDGQVSVSEVVRVMVGKGKDEITVYPNPVVGDVVAVQLNNVAVGRYSMVITNQLGQQVFVKAFEHAGGSATQTINLPKAVTPGVYQLQLIGDNVKYDLQIIKN